MYLTCVSKGNILISTWHDVLISDGPIHWTLPSWLTRTRVWNWSRPLYWPLFTLKYGKGNRSSKWMFISHNNEWLDGIKNNEILKTMKRQCNIHSQKTLQFLGYFITPKHNLVNETKNLVIFHKECSCHNVRLCLHYETRWSILGLCRSSFSKHPIPSAFNSRLNS